VVEFLDNDSRDEFGNKAAWDLMQNQILTKLEADA